ncbi:MAG TPA: hypothetical protein DCQ31_16840 [Bacteroidales bacterium]|nr:hypothetical protein [Bacteroidales bacterium]
MKRFLIFATAIMLLAPLNAQRKKLTVLNIDTKGMEFGPEQMGNLVRLEAERLDIFQVTDRYDVEYIIKKEGLTIDNCYGKLCLTEVGKQIKSDKMLTGTIERYGETIVVSIRLIDVAMEEIEKTQVREFLNLPLEMQTMVRIVLGDMFEKPVEKDLISKLTKISEYESTINNPKQDKVNLSGPRMGYSFYTGKAATILNAQKSVGGFDVNPALFIFGYQFEVQYLNQGNFQALFEAIPIIAGLDQSLLIPSFIFMNGLRNNKYGWEIAFGPQINFVKYGGGYYDANGTWNFTGNVAPPDGFSKTKRLDSRGDITVTSSFIVGIGKTFKSGRLSIPVNAFFVPDRTGLRFGISFGYNAKGPAKN